MKFHLLLFMSCVPFLLEAQIFNDVTATHLPSENMNLISNDAASGDLDGDGDLDLVVAADGQKNLLLFNEGDGTLMRDTARLFPDAAVYTSTTTGEKSKAVEIADFDGDGDLDVLFVSNGSAKNELLMNDGTGKFTYVFFPKVDNATSLLVADLGGDTLPDVLIGTASNLHLYINQGNTNFQLKTPTFFPNNSNNGLNTRGLQAGDLDNDGDLDIIEAYVGIRGFRVYMNNDGIFILDPSKLPSLTVKYEPQDIELADLDNDGDLDLYLASENGTVAGASNVDQLFVNDGTGVFTRTLYQLPINLLLINTKDVAFMDMNYDGYLDIMTVNPFLSVSYRILFNTPSNPGHFVVQNQLLPNFTDRNSQMLHLADFNGDGKEDIYIGNHINYFQTGSARPAYDDFYLSVLGVNTKTVSENVSIQVFPNPTNQYLTIQQDDTSLKMKMIQLFDTNGRMVRNQSTTNQFQHLIEVNDLPDGVYFLNILLENGTLNQQKILIQR